jgi:hypothetical protein
MSFHHTLIRVRTAILHVRGDRVTLNKSDLSALYDDWARLDFIVRRHAENDAPGLPVGPDFPGVSGVIRKAQR